MSVLAATTFNSASAAGTPTRSPMPSSRRTSRITIQITPPRVEPDRRQRRGQDPEPRREEGHEAIGEESLVKLPLQGLHAEDRHRVVDPADLVAQLPVERAGADRAADVEDGAAVARARHEHL